MESLMSQSPLLQNREPLSASLRLDGHSKLKRSTYMAKVAADRKPPMLGLKHMKNTLFKTQSARNIFGR